MVERMAKGLDEKKNVEELVQSESGRGLLRNLTMGGLMGSVGGGVLGRIAGGRESMKPFKDIMGKGLSRESLRRVRNVPRISKILALGGAGTGLLAGLGSWHSGRSDRKDMAREVARGLTAEQVLQRNALREAVKTDAPYSRNLLSGISLMPESQQSPHSVTLGHSGL
jgi:hypothetical protein